MSRWIDAEWLMNFFVDIPDNFTLTIGNLRATVNDAPSIDIEPKRGEWIPCSERLPSECGDYLTAYENGQRKMVDIDEWKGEWIDSLDGVKGWKIIAWMPLPEPWEGADDV